MGGSSRYNWQRSLPYGLRIAIERLFPVAERRFAQWHSENPYIGTPEEWTWTGRFPVKVAVAWDFAHQHHHYLRACHDMGLGYDVVNLYADDWLESVLSLESPWLLVWPSVYNSLWKTVCDERLRLLAREPGPRVHPDPDLIWLYESKRRLRDQALAHGWPMPRTWVFLCEEDALAFTGQAAYPLVLKTNLGASASGVWILRDKASCQRLVRRAFRRGLVRRGGEQRDPEWGCVLLQEYLEVTREWRMVRMWDRVMCREKQAGPDGLHSGSGHVVWATPPHGLLDQTMRLSDQLGVPALNIDFLETKDGRLLVNEVHAVFGAIEQQNLGRDEEAMGCWTRNNSDWSFAHGFYYHNACCNLRVQHLLAELGIEVPYAPDPNGSQL